MRISMRMGRRLSRRRRRRRSRKGIYDEAKDEIRVKNKLTMPRRKA